MTADDSQSEPRSDVRRFLRNLVLYFVALAAGVVLIQSWLVERALPFMGAAEWITLLKRDWARDGWVQFNPGKTRIAVLGDSRMLAAVDPAAFDAATGERTHTINLALPASTTATHLAMFREALEHGEKPDWLILALSPDTAARAELASYKSLGVRDPREVFRTAIRHPFGRKILLDWLLPARRFQERIVAWANGVLFHHDQLEGRKHRMTQFQESLRTQRGVHTSSAVADPEDPRYATPTHLNIDPDIDPATRTLLEFADAHGIRVLVVSAPIRPGKLQRAPATRVEAESVGADLPGVSFSREFFDPLELPLDRFSDTVHVNPAGSREFSEWLGREWIRIADHESAGSR